jgi:hypothetical protein
MQGTEGHNTAQIGGFVMLPPVIIAAAAATLKAGGSSAEAQAAAVAAAREAALTHLGATHDSRKLWGYADKYAALITKLALVSGCRSMGMCECVQHVCPWLVGLTRLLYDNCWAAAPR